MFKKTIDFIYKKLNFKYLLYLLLSIAFCVLLKTVTVILDIMIVLFSFVAILSAMVGVYKFFKNAISKEKNEEAGRSLRRTAAYVIVSIPIVSIAAILGATKNLIHDFLNKLNGFWNIVGVAIVIPIVFIIMGQYVEYLLIRGTSKNDTLEEGISKKETLNDLDAMIRKELEGNSNKELSDEKEFNLIK